MWGAAIAQAIGSAVVPAADAVKAIFKILKRKYDYVKDLDGNFNKLKEVKAHLCDQEHDVNEIIRKNEVRKEKTRTTTSWLDDVTKEKGEIEKLETRYDESKKCLCGICPFFPLLKISRDVVKKTKDVTDLRDRMNLENTILTERSPPRIERKFPKQVDGIPSLYENVEELLGYLKEKTIKKIGIWGPAGVGKTTIMKNLNEKLGIKTEMFHYVIWITVGKDWSIRSIQQVLVERLQLDVNGINTDPQIANLISQALLNKKYLLLLDEVFSEINLHDVGIHDDHEQGKLVLASRYRPVCDRMNLDEEVHVDRLSGADSLKLFRDLVGDNAFNHPRIKPIAELVVKECCGLPQVIKAVASNLRNVRNEDLWWNKWSKLCSPRGCKLKDTDDVFKAYELVFDDLDDDRRNCLKYGALFPEDYEICQDYLTECWKAQKFIDVSSFRRAREEGHAVLKDLIDTCLLERGGVQSVKMPILLRRFARGKYQEHELLVGQNEVNHSEEEWSKAKMISLVCTNVETLPERPMCRTASTLFLQKNPKLTKIPSPFFDFMSELNVLDLYCTGIESLPPSISGLINLRGLYLNNCCLLVRLPVEIKQLKYLEVLDIRHTGILSLPTEIGELSNLRCLRISFTSYIGYQNHVEAQPLEMVPSNHLGNHNHVEIQPMELVTSNLAGNQNHVDAQVVEMVPFNPVGRLSRLEELVVDVVPDELGWKEILEKVASGTGSEILDEVARELGALTQLSTLHFCFPSVECFETFYHERKLKRSNSRNLRKVNDFRSFKILVGPDATKHPYKLDISRHPPGRHLTYSAGSGTPPCPAITEVLKEASSVKLIGHRSAQSLSDFGIDAMQCWEVCILEECSEMEMILNSNMTGVDQFPYLEKLDITRLQRLSCIWEGSAVLGSLETLTLNDCSNIKKIFSWEMTQLVPKLQHLRVMKCSELVEVIEVKNQSGQITNVTSPFEALPKLKLLELVKLPNLVGIYKDDSLAWPSLENLSIMDCENLQSLSLNKTNAMQLRSIKCKQMWWNALVFQDDEVKLHLKDRCHFT